MLTKKILVDTFGAKIAPYGFEYAGYEHYQWSFIRMVDGEEQRIRIQRDIHGYPSFTMELPRGLGEEQGLGDFYTHYYDDDEGLEDLLNLIGDHFVRRVIPELEKPKPEKKKYEKIVTQEMQDMLWDRKKELARKFMERNGLDWECGTDVVMGKLLQEAEQVKGKKFHGLEERLTELAAVYGELLIHTIGGEWTREEVWSNGEAEKTVIGNFMFTNHTIRPLAFIYFSWISGGMDILMCYMSYLFKYRKWVAMQRDEYGDSWQPPKGTEAAGESLLDGKAVEETIGRKMAGLGFVCQGEGTRGWALSKQQGEIRETIQVRADEWGRRAFFAVYSLPGGRAGMYRYREFCFYEDEGDMYRQLERIGERMREALRQDRRKEMAWKMPSFCYHMEDGDSELFREVREELTVRFRRDNGLQEESGEEEILTCLAKGLDAIRGRSYKECRDALFGMAGVYGDLIIREIGGHWQEYEDWRLHQYPPRLVDLPEVSIDGIGRLNLPLVMVRYWEWEGGRTMLRAYREAKWQYEKWKELCKLGGLEIDEGR